MKIVCVSHSADLAGAERALEELVGVALQRGHRVEVWVPRRGPLCRRLIALGDVTVRRVPTHRWMSARGSGAVGLVRLLQCMLDLPAALHALRRSQADVVLVNTLVTPAAMLASRALGKPTVIMARESLRTNPSLRSIVPKRAIVWLLHHWADTIVAVSHYVRAQCEADIVIYSTIEAGDFGTEPLPAQHFLRVVYFGSITADKCPADAIEAVRLARLSGADIRLTMYGGGRPSDVRDIRSTIVSSTLTEYVTYLGEADGPNAALSAADVLVMTSRNEAFGRVTVEALVRGVPVVAYRSGGTVEILSSGGGLLVDLSPAAIAEALVHIYDNPEARAKLKEDALRAGRHWTSGEPAGLVVDVLETVNPRS